PSDDAALPGKGSVSTAIGNRITPLVQTQFGFPCLRVRAVTLKTLLRQDRPDVAIERHLSPGRLVCTKRRQLGQRHQQQGGDSGAAHKGSSSCRQYRSSAREHG